MIFKKANGSPIIMGEYVFIAIGKETYLANQPGEIEP
jgi:hypothetical protein